MKSNTLIRTVFAALVATFVALPSSHAAIVWSWASGDAPWVNSSGSNPAVFNDNNGAVWKFQDAPAGLSNPGGWETLVSGGGYYASTAVAPNGGSISTGSPAVFLQTGGSSPNTTTSSFALVFVAPITGTYSVSGAAWLGQWGGAGNAQIQVGKVQSNTFTQLALYEDPTNFGGIGPDFSTYTALNSISLTAGDSLAFILPHSGFNGQRWQFFDPSGVVDPNINLNALTISVPEPGTWALLAFSATTMMVLRRRRR